MPSPGRAGRGVALRRRAAPVPRDEAGRLRPALSKRRTVPLADRLPLASLSGPYYAYFATFLILVGGGIGVLRRPGADRVLDALAPAAVLVALLAAQLVPESRCTPPERG